MRSTQIRTKHVIRIEHSPPPVAEDVGLRDVDADNEGEAVAIVDAPGEDAVGQAAGGRREQVGDQGPAGGAAHGLAWKETFYDALFW